MKALLRGTVAVLFAALSRAIIRTYRPTIVMITGSVGKTSTKDAVAAALSPRFHLRASEKSYNSEFGVPLTIVGAKNPWNDFSAWLRVLSEALVLIFMPNHYPKLLVLEVGADRPGDLKHILNIATPDAVVVTKLPDVPVHVEAYASPSAVREEEFAPAYALAPGAPLIISTEDPYATNLAGQLAARVSTFGYGGAADVRLARAEVRMEEGRPRGMHAYVGVSGEKYELIVEGALGRQQLYAPAAALALALALGMKAKDALTGLQAYVPPSGRARILRGKNGSVLIDDTYNASPSATEEILESLALVPDRERRIVILGDMLELGRFSREQHERIGALAAERADIVVGVGERARAITDAARKAGKSEHNALHFTTAYEAGEALASLPRPGDLILVKGSQSVRTERIVEALLEDPKDAVHLVRQEKEWLKR